MSEPKPLESDDLKTWLAELRANAPSVSAPDRVDNPTCCDCSSIFTLGDAQRYGEEPSPKRCPRCRESRAMQKAIRDAGIPSKYEGARLDYPALRDRIVGGLPRWQDLVTRPWIVIHGSASGVGKTSLLVAQGLEAAKNGRRPLFVDAYELAGVVRTAKLGEESLIDTAIRADLLLLDEVGNEGPLARSALAEILHRRDSLERTTWATTAYDREALLGGGWSDHLVRRLYERAHVIQLRAPATRLRAIPGGDR